MNIQYEDWVLIPDGNARFNLWRLKKGEDQTVEQEVVNRDNANLEGYSMRKRSCAKYIILRILGEKKGIVTMNQHIDEEKKLWIDIKEQIGLDID